MAMTAAKLRTRVEATKRALRMLEGGSLRTRLDLFPGAEGEWPAVALRSLKDRGIVIQQRGFGVLEYQATARGAIVTLEGGALDEMVLEMLYPNGAPPVTLDQKMSDEDAHWLETLGWDLKPQAKQEPAPSSGPIVEPAPKPAPPPPQEPKPVAEAPAATPVAPERHVSEGAAEGGAEGDMEQAMAAQLRLSEGILDHLIWLENRLMAVDENVKKLLKALGE